MAYDARSALYLPQFGTAVKSGLSAGQELMQKKREMEMAQAQRAALGQLAPQLMAGDQQAMTSALQAGISPNALSKISALGGSGFAPFRGDSMDAQAANLQYERYIQAGYSPQDARISALNDTYTRKETTFVNPLTGLVETRTGRPLPDVSRLASSKTEEEYLANGASILGNTPPDQKQQVYNEFRQGLVNRGYEKPEDVPERYTPEIETAINKKPQNKGLYQQASKGTGLTSTIEAGTGYISAFLTGEISPKSDEALAARNALMMGQDQLKRAFVVNPKFAATELKSLEGKFNIKPEWFKDPAILQAKLTEMDRFLDDSYSRWMRRANSPSIHVNTRQKYHDLALSVQDFMEMMNVPGGRFSTAPVEPIQEQKPETSIPSNIPNDVKEVWDFLSPEDKQLWLQ